MPTVLGLDDSTYGASEVAAALRESGYRVLTTDDSATSLNLALETPWMLCSSTAGATEITHDW